MEDFDWELPEDLELPAFDPVDGGLFDDYLSALGSGALLQPLPSPSSDGSGPPASSRASRAQCADSGAHGDSDSGVGLPRGNSTASGLNSNGSPSAVFTAGHGSPGAAFPARSPSAESNRLPPPAASWALGSYGAAPQLQQPAGSSPLPPQPQGQWQAQSGAQAAAILPPIIELPSNPASLGLPSLGAPSPGPGLDAFLLPDFGGGAPPWPPASLAAQPAPDWGLQQQPLPQHSMAPGGVPGQTAGLPALGLSGQAELRLGLDQPGAAGGSNNQSSLVRGGEGVRGLLLDLQPPPASGGSGAADGSLAQQPGPEAGEAGEVESEEDAAGSGKKPRRRRNRSERQQMLNKLAQQRYRERKKQKAVDIEKAAAELSGRMQQYSLVEARHAQLTQRTAGLAQQLAAKEAELLQARAAAAQADLAEGSLEQELAEADAAAQQQQQTAAQLHVWLSARGLAAPGPAAAAAAAAQLPPTELRELEGLVQACSAAAARQQQLEGADAWQRVRSGAPGGPAPGGGGWEAWAETAHALQLSPEQCRKFALVRRQYVRKLEGVFAERQQLNLQAVGVMLPQERGGGGGEMLSGQAAGYVLLGFFQRARHTARLADVLEALKANLRAEQRAAAEVEYITQRRVLGPLQAAWLLLRAHPRRPDCLALASAVAHLCGEAAAPAPAPAAAWPGAVGSGGLPAGAGPGWGGGPPATSDPFQVQLR